MPNKKEMDLSGELNQLKLKVENARQQEGVAQGRLQELNSRLEEEFDCKTLKAGAALLAKMEKTIAAQKVKIEKGIEQVKDQMELA